MANLDLTSLSSSEMASESSTSDANVVLRLKTYKEDFELPLSKFAVHSALNLAGTKQEAVLSLYDFDVSAVQALVNYIESDAENKSLEVPSSSISQLLELARILKMATLSKSLENFVWRTAQTSPTHLTTALLLLSDPLLKDTQLGANLMQRAKSEFCRLSDSPFFGEINPTVIFEILDSCDLETKNELQIFQVVANYLYRRSDRLLHVFALLSCIRLAKTTDVDREKMLATLSRLPQGGHLKVVGRFVFDNENNFRICCLKEHESKPRCGFLPKHVLDSKLTIDLLKIDLENIHGPQKYAENKETLKTRTGRIVFATDVPRRTTRAERRAIREKQKLKDEELNRRILQGFRFGEKK